MNELQFDVKPWSDIMRLQNDVLTLCAFGKQGCYGCISTALLAQYN
ncbi:MAG: hypothetical protein ACYC3O_03810 [Burkholderiales bacterium]